MTLAYGEASKSSALESLSGPSEVSTIFLRNTYFGKKEKVIWQSGSLPLLRDGSYDAVIAEFSPRILSNVVACFLAKRRGIKFFWWGHGFHSNSILTRRVIFWLANCADAVIFYSEAGAQEMLAQGLPPQKTFTARNTIDVDEIARLSQTFAAEQRHRILCIGRLIPQKKVDLLMRGFALARPGLPAGTRLTIIGDGPERAALEALAQELGIQPEVELVGSLYMQRDLAPYFNTACFSVSAGYLGLSAIHSLAYGVPMIIADEEPHSPEIAATEAGTNVVLFRSDDAADLARNMTNLLRDRPTLLKMSRAAEEGIRRNFSLSAMVQSFEEAIVCIVRET